MHRFCSNDDQELIGVLEERNIKYNDLYLLASESIKEVDFLFILTVDFEECTNDKQHFISASITVFPLSKFWIWVNTL